MSVSFQHRQTELTSLIEKSFKFFKGNDTNLKHLMTDNVSVCQAVGVLSKENHVKFERMPSDIPTLNSIVERGFVIRWKNTKTLIQNYGLKPNFNKNKTIAVTAIVRKCTSLIFFYSLLECESRVFE